MQAQAYQWTVGFVETDDERNPAKRGLVPFIELWYTCPVKHESLPTNAMTRVE